MPDRLAELAAIAADAGDIIAAALGGAENVEKKAAVNLVTEVDHAAERLLIDAIRALYPNDAIVAEETASSRPPAGRCWYIDPLDGTTNFVHGLPHCSVSLGLLDDSGPLAAVVHDPCKGETFVAERGSGCWLGEQRLAACSTAELEDALLVTGFPYDRRDHVDFYLQYFKEFLLKARDVRRFGSAALDLAYVAAGRFDGFWEWKLSPWDTAAGWLLVEEAGGCVSDFDGGPYDPWAPRILACGQRLHAPMVAALAALPPAP